MTKARKTTKEYTFKVWAVRGGGKKDKLIATAVLSTRATPRERVSPAYAAMLLRQERELLEKIVTVTIEEIK